MGKSFPEVNKAVCAIGYEVYGYRGVSSDHLTASVICIFMPKDELRKHKLLPHFAIGVLKINKQTN